MWSINNFDTVMSIKEKERERGFVWFWMRRVGEFWWGGQKRVWELGWWWNLQWVASLKSQSSLCFCYQIFMWLVSLFYVFAFKKVIWTNNSHCCKRSGKLVLFGFCYAVVMSYIFLWLQPIIHSLIVNPLFLLCELYCTCK